MIANMQLRELVVIGATLAAGIAGTTVALASRGADDQFLGEQRHPPRLQAADVARVVASAPDPKTGKGRGLRATCMSRGAGPLRNPWSCVVRYRSGKRVRLVVQVQQDGTYDGRYAGVKGAATTGCCIDVPGTT